MFPDVNLKVERLSESNHTLLALEISFISQMVHDNMLFHNSMFMGAKVTLATIITVCLCVEFYVHVYLGFSWCQWSFLPFNFDIQQLGAVLGMALLPFRTWFEVIMF